MTQPRRTLGFLTLALLVAASASARFPVDEGDRVRAGGVPAGARTARDLGPGSPDLPLERITLALRPRAGAEGELARLLEAQQNPASPDYHRWITPGEFGRRFGASDDAIATVLDWVQAHGFAVDDVAAGRQWIHISGTAGQVEEAFGSPIHEFWQEGRLRHGNVSPPTIPRALGSVIRGVLSLDDFPKKHAQIGPPVAARRPEVDFQGGDHGMGPADFAVMYDVQPLYDLGIDGRGVSIAVVGRTDIQIADVRNFRLFFGLPANDPVFVHNGTDPGDLGSGTGTDGQMEESEADLDVEWAGAVAPNATIRFVISKSTTASDAADLSAQYAVDHDIAPILSSSFGLCERDLGSGNAFYEALWKQAAAQGITVFVPSGDSGAAGCDDPSADRGTGLAVSGLCSTPWNVCVGGTGLDDQADPARWWSPTEDPATGESLMSPVPEIAWNESGTKPGGSGLLATGGGPSGIYEKPSWQRAPGVPDDGRRDTPDVSLNAAAHDGYVVFQKYDPSVGTVYVVNGTSASTVAFAGLMALVVQSQAGARQGNANPVFYRMASAQFSGGSARPFRDIVSGDNSVPGVTGFSAGPGYDRVTGLGSVDAKALVLGWTAAASPRPRVVAAPPPVVVRTRARPPA
ncbi:MAG TPA: S53 family peptidase [Thermoanaerobaculia bacterium]|nr:S53 family peptidase [Thermoanaerobaculia bacterium]